MVESFGVWLRYTSTPSHASTGGNMRVFLGLCALFLWLAWSFDASGSVGDCMTDTECEEAAKKLCDEGHTQWCVEVA